MIIYILVPTYTECYTKGSFEGLQSITYNNTFGNSLPTLYIKVIKAYLRLLYLYYNYKG
jgi:hypothetical protein